MKKYKHKKIYVTTCPECKKLICCYRFNRLRKMCGKHPYCYCEEHSLWEPIIITEKDFVNIRFFSDFYDAIMNYHMQ